MEGGGFEDDVSLSPSPPPSKAPEDRVKPEVSAPADGVDGGDDDIYEDSLDLDTSQQHQRVMLVRLPEYLMAKLRESDGALSGADLGKVLVPEGPGADKNKMRVLLNSQIELLRPLPHRYDMNVISSKVDNVYVLKEQDLKRKRTEAEGGGVRHAKKTALVGHAMNECTMVADMSDPNYSYVMQRRKLMELPSAERQTTLLDSTAGVGGAKYGATLRQQKEMWRKPVQKRQLARQTAEGKATRMPRNDLLDILFRCFEETPYWTIRSLRERTRQPEVYLRSVLDSIAVLNKRGPYAMRYGLREEYKSLQNSGATVESMVERAPSVAEQSEGEGTGEGAGEGAGDQDGDSDEMEMENVEIV